LGVQQLAGTVRLGTVRRDVLAGLQMRGEAAVYQDDIGDPGPFIGRPTGSLRGMMQAEAFLLHDSMNEAAFPTRGMRLRASVTGARDGWLSNESFARTLLRVRGRVSVPFVQPLTAIVGGTAGRTFGTPPLHHRFFLGGVFPHRILEGRQFPFWGADVQERAGTNLWEVMAGVQVGLPLDFTATIRWNAARVAETWAWLPEPASFSTGGGIGVGRETIVGPVEVVVGGRGLDGPYSVRLQLGTPF
jgi:outer membrane protein assembly factor BamA